MGMDIGSQKKGKKKCDILSSLSFPSFFFPLAYWKQLYFFCILYWLSLAVGANHHKLKKQMYDLAVGRCAQLVSVL